MPVSYPCRSNPTARSNALLAVKRRDDSYLSRTIAFKVLILCDKNYLYDFRYLNDSFLVGWIDFNQCGKAKFPPLDPYGAGVLY